jgi:hypothetical protein
MGITTKNTTAIEALMNLTVVGAASTFWIYWPWLSAEYSRQESLHRELI